MLNLKAMVKELQKERPASLHRSRSSRSTGMAMGKPRSNKEPGSSGKSKLSLDDIKYSKTLMLGDCSLAYASTGNTSTNKVWV